ncbi:30S ribosomal protein S15 [Candidatus Saccharibacteria bacterium RIFCSPHIGHO2_02_FULL_47_12]|nr:MAG: 30S ribosomal protein S15 [Candidatus Saccharibacteria bacterium RIFCSPHIGHO2_02_FULL_47_12]
MLSSEKKQAAIVKIGAKKTDTGSSASQVAILTERIAELTGHLKTHKKDFMARRGLLQAVGKRKRLLKYISEKDSQAYLALIEKLGLRK